MADHSQITFSQVLPNEMDTVLQLERAVFACEQNIPDHLIPIPQTLRPEWWCVRISDKIVGSVAGWIEQDQWHWGRFAIDQSLRSQGIGKKLAEYSLNEIFKLDAEEIYIEARDIAARMLVQFGAEVVGEPVDFYGQPVTPIILRKGAYNGSNLK